MKYTLEKMPRGCRTLFDTLQVHRGQAMNIDFLCDLLGYNAELKKECNHVKSLMFYANEVEQNIWDGYPKKVIKDVIYLMNGKGKWIKRGVFFERNHIPYCDSHKIPRLKAGRGNRYYTIPMHYSEDQHFFNKEIHSGVKSFIRNMEKGKSKDFLLNDTQKKVRDAYLPIYDDIKKYILNDNLDKLRKCINCRNGTIEAICPLCGSKTE